MERTKRVCLCGCGQEIFGFLHYFASTDCEEQHCRNENIRYAKISAERELDKNKVKIDRGGKFGGSNK